MEEQIKSFRQQFIDCRKDGMHGEGPFMKWKDHPELLPLPWSKAAKMIAEEIKKNPDAGMPTISCKRFGGICTSGNPKCRALRGLKS